MARPTPFRVRTKNLRFQSTRHLRGATQVIELQDEILCISIHAPLTWRDGSCVTTALTALYFNPRATYVARQGKRILFVRELIFQSTRHLRGATNQSVDLVAAINISIHAPLTWRDGIHSESGWNPKDFNPRATYVARRIGHEAPLLNFRFQSTRHLRGATKDLMAQALPVVISIHAPLTWRDFYCLFLSPSQIIFQSTRHLRGATISSRPATNAARISIHAPLTWRDPKAIGFSYIIFYFNPRATYVARRHWFESSSLHQIFQSTRHLRGATYSAEDHYLQYAISIHAPLTWRDAQQPAQTPAQGDFNPRATYVARP